MQSESAPEPYRLNVEPSTSSYTHPQSGTRNQLSKNVRILLPISGRLIHSRSPRPDSAKMHGNSVRRIAYRKTDEFPVPVTVAVIGRCRKKRTD
jgi:hypothetical protein